MVLLSTTGTSQTIKSQISATADTLWRFLKNNNGSGTATFGFITGADTVFVQGDGTNLRIIADFLKAPTILMDTNQIKQVDTAVDTHDAVPFFQMLDSILASAFDPSALLDSLARHLDSLQKHRIDINAIENATEAGTAQGQIKFWDNSLSKWVHTETGEMVYDDINKRFGIRNTTPTSALHVRGNVEADYGVDLVVNGGFDSNTIWSTGVGVTISSGAANFNTGSSGIELSQNIGIVAGYKYEVTYTILNYSSGSIRVNVGGIVYGSTKQANGTYTEYINATTSNGRIYLISYTGGFVGSIDNVVVRLHPVVDFQSLYVSAPGNIGFDTYTPTNILSFGNSAARKIWIENSATDVVGRDLTVAAGSTVAGTSVSNVVGGNLIFQTGLGTGIGGNNILFQTGTPLTTGTTLQTMSTKMTLLGKGYLGILTTAPDKPLEVNSPTGLGIRTTYNDADGSAANYVDYSVGATGDATITPSGGDLTVVGNLGIGTIPSTQLEVEGTFPIIQSDLITNTASYAGFYSGNDGTLTTYLISGGTTKSGTNFGINNASSGFLYTNNGALAIGTANAYDLTLGTNSTGNITLKNGGNSGFGITSPTSVIHLKAGSATAGTSPLGFTSGPLLTVPVAGKVEFLTDRWYGTITTGALRKPFAFVNDITDSLNLIRDTLAKHRIDINALSTGVAIPSTQVAYGTGTGITSDANLTRTSGLLTLTGRFRLDNGAGSVYIGKSNGELEVGAEMFNTGIGESCLTNNTIGAFNDVSGHSALYANDSGSYNSVHAVNGYVHNIGGSYISSLGAYGGSFIFDGTTPNTSNYKTVFLGANIRALTATDTNAIVIGADAISNGSRTATIGDTTITDVYIGQTGSANIHINGLYDSSGDAGTLGQVFSSTVTGTNWIDASAVGQTVDTVRIYDSIAVHLDTLKKHRIDINAISSKIPDTLKLSGDVSATWLPNATGTTTIGDDKVTYRMLNDNVISGQTELTTGVEAVDEILISDASVAGQIKRMKLSVLGELGLMKKSVTSLTSIQVSDLGTKKTLIAAPGAGYYIKVLGISVKLVNTDITWVDTQQLQFGYTSTSALQTWGYLNLYGYNSGTYNFHVQPDGAATGGSLYLDMKNNEAFTIGFGDGNDPPAGTATMRITVNYTIEEY